MNIDFQKLASELINVFQVTQLSPGTFLEDILGLDYIVIAPMTQSEVHRHGESDNIIFILRGAAILMLDEVKHDIVAGQRVIIPRKVTHGFRTFRESLEFISAQIPPILDKRTGRFDREVVK